MTKHDNALKVTARRPATPMTDAEWKMREDLAASYRLALRHGWDDLIYTHITARVPGKEEHFLINPFGLAFEEIKASNLVKVDIDGAIIGESEHAVNMGGYTIHSAVHAARPEVVCVMHLHIEAGMALSMLECGLLPLSQHAMLFYNRIGYHKYEGPALDTAERERLIADLGSHNALILHNHGLLTCGRSVAEAFMRMFYLARAATTQIQAMAAGVKLVQVPDHIAELTAERHEGDSMPFGVRAWPAMLRRLDREDPSYKE